MGCDSVYCVLVCCALRVAYGVVCVWRGAVRCCVMLCDVSCCVLCCVYFLSPGDRLAKGRTRRNGHNRSRLMAQLAQHGSIEP